MSEWLFHVSGPRDGGPGERRSMLERARALLEEAGAEEIVRLDPSAGGEGEASLVDVVVPALQSGSLFGSVQGVEVVDAQSIQKADAEVLAELLQEVSGEGVRLVFVSTGALPAPLSKVVRSRGQVVPVRKMRERDAAEWLGGEARRRGMRLPADAAQALLQRFGTDTDALSAALDQLASSPGPLDRETVMERFRNRPDEPMWHYADAVGEGQVGEALRRLADFLVHGHPLQLLAFLENDLRRRSLAAAAPDLETFAAWAGGSADSFPIKKAWRRRGAVSDGGLRQALDALSRADGQLKSAPEELHRLTMERLTVALCRWYGSPSRS